ncbi:MAG: 2-oxoglutarate dehydrogenase E1 component [Alphaproteobacteria bacterium]
MHRGNGEQIVEASFLTGTNGPFIAELFSRYLDDPASVDPSWVEFFKELGDNRLPAEELHPGLVSVRTLPDATVRPPVPSLSKDETRSRILDSIRALMMIRVYRVRGHLLAELDPLRLSGERYHPELDYRSYGFSEADLDREIFIDNVLGLETATLRQIIEVLRATYCGNIGVEFMHIQDPDQKAWIQKRIETIRNQTQFTEQGKLAILERLTEAEEFERFLDRRYVGTKRFGLEGGEALIPLLEQILKRGSQLGVTNVVLGMAHRGRLNVLANVLKKPYHAIFSEFQGNPAHPEDVQGSGDVKYHLGTSADREFDGKVVHLSLIPNPSHLEAADPVVLGKVRANQMQRGGEAGWDDVLGIILHGDAAFAGQGIVSECFGLSQLDGYRTGGSIHVIINNQIGFTTSPSYGRSTPYSSDVAKGVQAPILHVNGDDPESVVHVARIATEFRQLFNCDIVIDMVCYRRHGHNEADEPAFTQPAMYRKIAHHPTTREIYVRSLVNEGLISPQDAERIVKDFHQRLEQEFQAAASYKPNKADWLEGKWKGLVQSTGEEELREDKTWVDPGLLQEVGRALVSMPEGYSFNSKIVRQLQAKARMFETGEEIDWATAEALAFGTLLAEGTPVRLSGQDCRRGTFSQRHAALVDQNDERRYIPLNHIRPTQAHFEVLDSPLSEASVLGFEYGYTLTEPDTLVLWEAQFGDFANGAQVIIDQFIASGESKWLRLSGLTLLLPHGYEGQGPEHSSGRVERYLQLCAEDNMQVCNCTTPANYFHALRRQMRRNFRKPLVVMTPKSLLRHKSCVSALADFGPGSAFHRVLPEAETLVPDSQIRRVVLCSGKVYYDLLQRRTELGLRDVALIRVEQLYPWPRQSLLTEIERYPAADVVWCQEEPANMGPFVFVDRRLQYILEELKRNQRAPIYAGRVAQASTAAGVFRRHLEEQALLVEQALRGEADEIARPFLRSTAMSLLRSPK